MYSSFLSKHFWKEHTFWTDGYFACCVGNVSEKILKNLSRNKDTLLSTKFLDSSARYECVKNYLKNHVIPELRSEDLNNYVEDIIKKRNKLAHTFEENSFTEKQKIEILKCLSRYKKLFDKF